MGQNISGGRSTSRAIESARWRYIFIRLASAPDPYVAPTGGSVTDWVITPPPGYSLASPSPYTLNAGETVYAVEMEYERNSVRSYSLPIPWYRAPVPSDRVLPEWQSGRATTANQLVRHQDIIWRATVNDDGNSGAPGANTNFTVLKTQELRAPTIGLDGTVYIGIAQQQFDITSGGAKAVVLPITRITGEATINALWQREGNGYRVNQAFNLTVPSNQNTHLIRLYYTFRNRVTWNNAKFVYRLNGGAWADLYISTGTDASVAVTGPTGISTFRNTGIIALDEAPYITIPLVQNDLLEFGFTTTIDYGADGAGVGNATVATNNGRPFQFTAAATITSTHRLETTAGGELLHRNNVTNTFERVVNRYGIVESAGLGLRTQLLFSAGNVNIARFNTINLNQRILPSESFDRYAFLYFELSDSDVNNATPVLVSVAEWRARSQDNNGYISIHTRNDYIDLVYISSTSFRIRAGTLGIKRIYGVV